MASTDFTPAQLATIRRLGYPTDQGSLNRLSGNGRLQQFLNQQASLRGLGQPFHNSAASALFQDLIPIGAIGAAAALPAEEAGAGVVGAEAAAAGGAGAAASVASRQIGKRAALAAGGLAGADLVFGDTKDFLKFISWLFHPLNWLRMVEFLTGMFFLYLGFKGATRAYRRGPSVTSGLGRRIFNFSPLGRKVRVASRARGYREGAEARERAATT